MIIEKETQKCEPIESVYRYWTISVNVIKLFLNKWNCNSDVCTLQMKVGGTLNPKLAQIPNSTRI